MFLPAIAIWPKATGALANSCNLRFLEALTSFHSSVILLSRSLAELFTTYMNLFRQSSFLKSLLGVKWAEREKEDMQTASQSTARKNKSSTISPV